MAATMLVDDDPNASVPTVVLLSVASLVGVFAIVVYRPCCPRRLPTGLTTVLRHLPHSPRCADGVDCILRVGPLRRHQ